MPGVWDAVTVFLVSTNPGGTQAHWLPPECHAQARLSVEVTV